MASFRWYEQAYGQMGADMAQLPWTHGAQSEATHIAQSLGLSPGKRILDVGCGYGRHILALSRMGLDVTGIEISEPLADEARRRLAAAGVAARILQQDARVPVDEQFDCVLCLAEGPIGYLESESENMELFRSLAAKTKPGGILLMELVNGEAVIQSCPTKFWCDGEGGLQASAWRYDSVTGYSIRMEKVVLATGRSYSWQGRVRVYTYPEICGLLHSVGFENCASFSCLDLATPFNGQSWDMVIRAHRGP